MSDERRQPPPWQQTRIIWNTSLEPEHAALDPGEPDGPAMLVGGLFFVAWRLLGLLALFPLLLHPTARRHIVGLVAPDPGFIWLHGASAGEHVAARALQPFLPARVFRTSSSWRTPVVGAFPAPLDLPFVIERWLDRARPSMLVLVEAELWPGWLEGCRRRGIPVVVVNARPGRGTARWRRVPALWRWLTKDVQFVPQTETGDLKLSASFREVTFQLGRDAVVAGSTRPGDEERVLDGWLSLPEPRPMLVIAPRHLERLPEVEGIVSQRVERWCRRSEGIDPDADVVILDTMGELAGLYRQARAAIIGGTWDEAIGGHSPAEALSAGLPVVRGPHHHANPYAWQAGIVLTGDVGVALRQALSMGPRAPSYDASAERAAALLPEGNTPPEMPLRPWLAPVASVLVRERGGDGARVEVPVVSVGSLVAGGAGKTPVVAWLAEHLEGVVVVGRGYRRSGGREVRTEGALGDELEMLRRRGVTVVSAPDRVAGARAALELGARLVVLDDGFQHTALDRDLDIVCIDARWPDGRGPIPVGWRREPWSALSRADWLWINHGPLHGMDEERYAEHLGDLPRVVARHVPKCWAVGGEERALDTVEGPIDVVVGIARPEGFLSTLLEMGLEVRTFRSVRDHGELGRLAPGTVVTDKDAARLPVDADVRVLKIGLEVEGAEPLLERIRELV